ncbi:MAG: hypothetical protein ACTH31_13190, partial [Pseudoclavibacter sp.]
MTMHQPQYQPHGPNAPGPQAPPPGQYQPAPMGYAPVPYGPPAPRPTNTMAIVALIGGIMTGILGIIFG